MLRFDQNDNPNLACLARTSALASGRTTLLTKMQSLSIVGRVDIPCVLTSAGVLSWAMKLRSCSPFVCHALLSWLTSIWNGDCDTGGWNYE